MCENFSVVDTADQLLTILSGKGCTEDETIQVIGVMLQYYCRSIDFIPEDHKILLQGLIHDYSIIYDSWP